MRSPWCWQLALTLLFASCSIDKVTFAGETRVIAVTTSVDDGSYGLGTMIPIQVVFDAPVAVTGTPSLRITARDAPIAYSSGSGTDTLTFVYRVRAGDRTDRLDYTTSDALSLDGGAITDAHGDAIITLPAPGAPGSLAEVRRIAIAITTTTFAYSGALQTFTVPDGARAIEIDARGAEGGRSTGESGGMMIVGGRGGRAVGTFEVAAGESIAVLVGGIGANSNCGSGGGGGTWAVRGSALLVVAGGGGGGFHCNALGAVEGVGGGASSSGGNGACTPMRDPAIGGADGMGGTSRFGGGGGGWLTAGTQTVNTAANGGGAYPGGGGTLGGGFGGGGGHYDICCGGSGGGGGYSGGSGGLSDGCAGGGGGSLSNGSDAAITAGEHAGAGQVIISW